MNNEETLVSSCIELIAEAKSLATLKTSSRPLSASGFAFSRSGIVFVTITFFKYEPVMFSIALPERTGCVKHA